MRDIQVLILKEAGYTATAVAGAREALDRLAELAPDLILLDLSMPGMDGHELLLRMRKLPNQVHRSTPAIALTAFDNPAHRRKAQEVGFNAYLAKPLDPELVVLAIARLVTPA